MKQCCATVAGSNAWRCRTRRALLEGVLPCESDLRMMTIRQAQRKRTHKTKLAGMHALECHVPCVRVLRCVRSQPAGERYTMSVLDFVELQLLCEGHK